MCGIFLYHSNKSLTTDVILRSREALAAIDHRGPDGQGMVLLNTENGNYVFVRDANTPGYCKSDDLLNIQPSDYNCILAHKRLSIFDLSENGFQPMCFDGDIIVFNGEIYNWKALQEPLKAKAHTFRTATDTEVILKSYLEYGPAMLDKFNGMWAIIIWDSKRKQFFVSRDRYGVKPMSCRTFDDGSYLIASEEKQIHKFERKAPEINFKNLQIFVNEGHAATDTSSFYQQIVSFPPASFSEGKPGDILLKRHVKKYYSVQIHPGIYTEKNENIAIETFNEIFHSAVDYRLKADVAAGFSLSGGLDSSRIVYETVANKNYNFEPEFFSAIFPGSEVNEQASIQTVADDLNIKPNFCYPDTEFILDDFSKLTYVLDSPVPDLSYYAQWSVSNLVGNHHKKILVVGQGADEVFAGYHHHFYRFVVGKLLRGKISQARTLMNQYADLKGWERARVQGIVNSQLKETLKSKVKKHLLLRDQTLSEQWNTFSNLEEMLLADLNAYQIPYFLKADDRIGMWHGFESRYPFLDYRLVNFGFNCSGDLKIKNGWQKWIIRKSFNAGPESIVWRKDKVGYRMPAHAFFENESLVSEAKAFLNKHIHLINQNTYRTVAAYLWLQQYK